MFFNEDIVISLIIAILILVWFKSCYRIIDEIVPNNTFNNILGIIISVSVLYIINEGNLYTLGKSTKDENIKDNINGYVL